MSFLTPIAALGALIIIPIILLYMLRLRRREMLISSNFLWQQIVRDHEANTPWQRLRRNVLMILQIIAVVLLVLALMRPAQLIPTISAGKTVILLDASASMNATDIDGRTRFEEAQRQASLILGHMSVEDEMSIIRVADAAETLIGYSNDINALRTAINNAQVGQGRGDWATALTLAAAGAKGADNFNIIIISDGRLSDASQLPENIPQPIYIPIGESAENIAITALATRTLPGQNPQLFAQIQNFDPQAVEISLLIRLNGEIWQSITETISAESMRSFVFDMDLPFTTIQAELILDDSVTDYLELDNIAFTVAGDVSTRSVLLLSPQRNIFLEEVLRSIPNVQIFRGDTVRTTLPETAYDLYVFNNWLPASLPDADMLIINPPGNTELFARTGMSESSRNLRVVNRSHPLAAFLTMDAINLRQFQTLTNTAWAQVIAETSGGPIIFAGEDRGRQIAIISFDLFDSDLALNIAWPIFMSNMIEWAAPTNIISGGAAFSVGDVVRINPPLDASGVRITAPDGRIDELEITATTLTFADTHQPGLYRVDILNGDGVKETQYVAINLFGTGESKIEPLPEGQLNLGGGELDAEAEEQFGFRELWPLLTMIALLVLLYEWYYYHKRIEIPTTVQTDLHRTTARR
jgi:hypothetical protein